MTALCGIAKLENHYVKEWVDYHLGVGFDHVFLYDNNDPGTERVEDVFPAPHPRLTIVPWPSNDGIDTQERAYTDCYRRYGGMFDWMAFFDIDEFLVLKTAPGLKERLEKATAENILVPWQVFTWSGKCSRDLLTPVMEDFTETVDEDCDIVKSIVKTGLPKILDCGVNVHGQYKAKTYADLSGNTLEPTVPHGTAEGVFTRTRFAQFNGNPRFRDAVLNHYWSKSLDEFFKFKMRRGYLNPKLKVKLERLYRYCNPEDVERVRQYITGLAKEC